MQPAPSQPPAVGPQTSRRHERTALFVAASLYSKTDSCPIHVRNISTSGALIEGAIVPANGDSLVLKRGGLEAAASIVWKEGRRAGVSFSSTVDVADWMARQPTPHQGRVDGMIRTIRMESATAGRREPIAEDVHRPSSSEAELLALRKLLADLEKDLTADVILVATHPEIQALDIALQAIDRMLGVSKSA